jgi:spore coat protein U-like protein
VQDSATRFCAGKRRRFHDHFAIATLWRPHDSRELRLPGSRRSRSPTRRVTRAWLPTVILLVAFSAIFIRPAKAALSCTITAISGGYGAVNILSGAASNSTAAFSVSCTGGGANAVIRLCVEIGLGSTAAGPSSERVLRSSSDFLDHEFYTSAARTTIWGSWGSVVAAYASSGLQQDLTLNGSGTGTANFTAFSAVLANQKTKTPGSYTWAGGTSPAMRYAVKGANSCPTGANTRTSSGSSYTATINANCLVSATNLNFGSTSSLASNVDATSTVTVQCTNSTAYTVALNAGTGTGATITVRKMTSGANTINYSLYTNSARSVLWGNGTTGVTQSGTGSGNQQVYTVFGRIPPQSSPIPGSYSDTITVTVTY